MWKIILILLLLFIKETQTKSIHDTIYQDIGGFTGMQLLNKNGDYGGTSGFDPLYGELYLIEEESDFEKLINDPPSKKLVLVLNAEFFSFSKYLDRLPNKITIAGVILLPGNKPGTGYSPEMTYPLKASSLHPESDYEWNSIGNGDLYKKYFFPILTFPLQGNFQFIKDMAKQNKRDLEFFEPRNGAVFDIFMQANEDSETCLRRKTCVPIGGQSVWGFIGGEYNKSKEYIMITTPLDTRSSFPYLSPGSEFPSSGIVALLSAIDGIISFANSNNATEFYSSLKRQIMFGFWDGESFGHIGSLKFINDVKYFDCKEWNDSSHSSCNQPFRYSMAFKDLDLSKLTEIIEPNQVGLYTGNPNNTYQSQLYTHYEKENFQSLVLAEKIMMVSINSLKIMNLSTVEYPSPHTPGIPPSSSESFVRKIKSDLPVVVLTDYPSQFSNAFYSSVFDDIFNIETQQIAGAASLLLRTVYMEATGCNPEEIPENLAVNETFIRDLMFCFSFTYYCQYFVDILGIPFNVPSSNYPGLFSDTNVPIRSKFLHDFITYLTLVQKSSEFPSCKSGYDCNSSENCIVGKCYPRIVYFHPSYSNNVEYDYKQKEYKVVESYFPDDLWVESDWKKIQIQVYQGNSKNVDILVFCVGIFLILLDCFMIKFFKLF
ncbi:nicastrin [Anaeramoeba ignava]|uniref:Nicastrin n=1 Tax=Anaeramoeba ignava TaxID=1746090 RepID=A0A9Q0LNN4_ANAIG|nr:nicastrin [Anaeramoeba ignava]